MNGPRPILLPAAGRLVVASALLAACRRDPPSPPVNAHAPAVEPVEAREHARDPGASVQQIPITVDATGYHPDTLHVRAGHPVTLLFTRTSDEGCGQQVVFPSLDLRRDLPLAQTVAVTVTPPAGTLSFTCGMNMYRGAIVALP